MKRAALFLSLIASVGIADAQVIQAPGTPANGPYVDSQSGMTFPVAVGSFNRFRVTRGGPPDEISAGYEYTASAGRVSATIIVWHPQLQGKMDCVAEAANDIQAARDKLPGGQASEQSEAPPVDGYPNVTGRMLHTSFNGPSGQQVGEEYLYCNVANRWLVQYIFTHLASFDASKLEARFLRDFHWTVATQSGQGDPIDHPAPAGICSPKPGEGARWLAPCEQAANAGDAHAALVVGVMYWNGDGVPRDHPTAALWFQKADKAGEPRAAKALGDWAIHPPDQGG